MSEGVEVDGVVGDGQWVTSDLTLDNGGVTQVRSLLDAAGELGGELPEAQVLGVLRDEVKRRRVPEARRASVTEQDLVAVGQVK